MNARIELGLLNDNFDRFDFGQPEGSRHDRTRRVEICLLLPSRTLHRKKKRISERNEHLLGPLFVVERPDGPVAFEIDRIDDGMREGWSVLVTGRARVLTEPELHVLAAGVTVEPWAGGARDLYVAVEPENITGRRIRAW